MTEQKPAAEAHEEIRELVRSPACVSPQRSMKASTRRAIEWFIEMAMIDAPECDEELATLRKLLERMK